MAGYLNQIRFHDIAVANLEYSLAWYHSFLGFEVRSKNDQIGVLSLGRGPDLILTAPDFRSSMGKLSMDERAVPRFLRSKGVPVTPLRDEYIGRYFGFIDPDGNMYSVLKGN